jgi:hypothetical protein
MTLEPDRQGACYVARMPLDGQTRDYRVPGVTTHHPEPCEFCATPRSQLVSAILDFWDEHQDWWAA